MRGTETVVEIGPGRGALTEILLTHAARVVAIELDRDLAAGLRVRFADDPRLTILTADVLTVPLAEAANTADYVVAGNVPYYITTPILFHSLRMPRPARAVYLVQREVAERVVAAPGTKVYGALSVNVQAVACATIAGAVSAGSFVPPPPVESAILRIDPTPTPAVTDAEQAGYAAFVIAAFGLRRKQNAPRASHAGRTRRRGGNRGVGRGRGRARCATGNVDAGAVRGALAAASVVAVARDTR